MNLLGHSLRDRVSGFVGVGVAYCQNLAGFEQYCIKPPLKADGTLAESAWIDTCQLEDLGAEIEPGTPEINQFKLGETLREKTSGAVGTVVSINTHLNGCVRLEIAIPLRKKDAKPQVWYWDHKSFERLPESKPAAVKVGTHGGPHDWMAR